MIPRRTLLLGSVALMMPIFLSSQDDNLKLERWAIQSGQSFQVFLEQCVICNEITPTSYLNRFRVEYRVKRWWSLIGEVQFLRSRQAFMQTRNGGTNLTLGVPDVIMRSMRNYYGGGGGSQLNIELGRGELVLGGLVGPVIQKISETLIGSDSRLGKATYNEALGFYWSAHLGYTYWPTQRFGLSAFFTLDRYQLGQDWRSEIKNVSGEYLSLLPTTLLPEFAIRNQAFEFFQLAISYRL
ncbi:MAG: hypothetical protein AAFU03_08220 [Bacteroidota bacterium]